MPKLSILLDVIVGGDVHDAARVHCVLFRTWRGSWAHALLH